MKKLSAFTKIALVAQIIGIFYGLFKQSLEMTVICSLFLVLCVREIKNNSK